MSDRYFATIVSIIDEYTAVINKGSSSGITSTSKFLIVEIGDEIIDPDTNESLGLLEITKGWCKTAHVQENMCTIKSDEYDQDEGSTEVTKTKGGFALTIGGITTTEVSKPGRRFLQELKNVNVGDKIIARGIKTII